MLLTLGVAALLLATADDAERKPQPVDATPEVHGRVVLDALAAQAGVPAVTFDHWRHRTAYTCRACHVDLGFAMKAGETQVSAATNEAGSHCGACHDGRRAHEGRTIFRACNGWPRADPARGCTRCHTGRNHGPGRGWDAFKESMPLDRAGDVDWDLATRRGLIKPADGVEGISPRRAPLRIDREVDIRPSGSWMNGVTFSHRKHVAWVGCELCHPEIFPISRRGSSPRYGMAQIRAGAACGACHLTVAFPVSSCDRCHVGENRLPVQ